jgi:peptidoglycan hydrolase CwlO-like protein
MDTKTKTYIGLIVLAIIVIGIVVVLVRYYQSSNQTKDNYSNCDKSQIRENFPPSVTNVNVLYTDQYGNLGATSDLGINYLTVANGTNLQGNVTIQGSLSGPTISSLQQQINDLTNKVNTNNTTINTKVDQINTTLDKRLTTLENNLKELNDKLKARFPDDYTLDLKGGRIVQGGDFFHFTGQNSKGTKSLAYRGGNGDWTGW